MKAFSSLVCVVAACLFASAVAQIPQCEGNVDHDRLLMLLQTSPNQECTSQMVTIAGVQDYVAEAAAVFQALAVICEPVCLEFVRTFAQECIPSYIPLLGLACGRNEQARFCYRTVSVNNGTLLLAQCYPHLYQPTLPPATTAAAENTTDEPDVFTNSTTEAPITSTPPPFMCSSVCRSALEKFRAYQGCCVSNAFNTSAFGILQYGIASYSLWGPCGVETVSGNCSSPFVDATSMPTDSSYTLVAHGVRVSLLAVLMVFLLIV